MALRGAALLALALAGGLALPVAARAQEGELAPLGGVNRRTVLKNSFLQLGPFVTLDAKCRPIAQAQARIVVAPRHGRLRVLRKRGEVAFAADHPLAHCNDRPVTGTTLFFRPHRNFIGPDTFTYELHFKDGEHRRVSYWLKVVAH